MVSCSELEDEDDDEDAQKDLQKPSSSNTDDRVLIVLEALPERMSWKEIFQLPHEIREQVATAIRHAKSYADKVKEAKELAKLPTQCITCNTAVSFIDDDLLLGSKPHNHPLFVTGYIQGQKVKCILVDGGSAINIMPKSTMNDLGITVEELSKSRMMIQGFNLKGQRTIGMIRLKLTMGDLSTTDHPWLT